MRYVTGKASAFALRPLSLYNGFMITFSKNQTGVYEQTWDSNDDWTLGTFTNTVSVNDTLIPQEANGLSLASKWEGVFPLDAIPESSVYGLYFDWVGDDFTLEVSLDGTTWETVAQRDNVALIPSGFDPTEKAVLVRISFAGGVVEDPAFVSSLTATVMLSNQITTVDGRAISFTGHSELLNEGDPALPTDDWGLRLRSGVLTIGANTAPDATDTRGMEVWVKPITGTSFVTNFAGTSYVNGVAGTTIANGQWSLVTITNNTSHTGSITITGDYQIGLVTLYSTALTASEVQSSYYSYVGFPSILVSDGSTITIAEPATAVLIYSYDWAITGAGG